MADVYDVWVVEFGSQEKAIPVLRRGFGLDETTAQKLVQRAPICVKRNVTLLNARAVEARLEAAGAQTRIVLSGVTPNFGRSMRPAAMSLQPATWSSLQPAQQKSTKPEPVVIAGVDLQAPILRRDSLAGAFERLRSGFDRISLIGSSGAPPGEEAEALLDAIDRHHERETEEQQSRTRLAGALLLGVGTLALVALSLIGFRLDFPFLDQLPFVCLVVSAATCGMGLMLIVQSMRGRPLTAWGWIAMVLIGASFAGVAIAVQFRANNAYWSSEVGAEVASLRRMDSPEAKLWLQKSGRRGYGLHRGVARRWVDATYEAGAQRIEVVKVDDGGAGEVAQVFFVELGSLSGDALQDLSSEELAPAFDTAKFDVYHALVKLR